jgi:hypothetical protein
MQCLLFHDDLNQCNLNFQYNHLKYTMQRQKQCENYYKLKKLPSLRIIKILVMLGVR